MLTQNAQPIHASRAFVELLLRQILAEMRGGAFRVSLFLVGGLYLAIYPLKDYLDTYWVNALLMESFFSQLLVLAVGVIFSLIFISLPLARDAVRKGAKSYFYPLGNAVITFVPVTDHWIPGHRVVGPLGWEKIAPASAAAIVKNILKRAGLNSSSEEIVLVQRIHIDATSVPWASEMLGFSYPAGMVFEWREGQGPKVVAKREAERRIQKQVAGVRSNILFRKSRHIFIVYVLLASLVGIMFAGDLVLSAESTNGHAILVCAAFGLIAFGVYKAYRLEAELYERILLVATKETWYQNRALYTTATREPRKFMAIAIFVIGFLVVWAIITVLMAMSGDANHAKWLGASYPTVATVLTFIVTSGVITFLSTGSIDARTALWEVEKVDL